jgi:F1F0 ATPase subunit 2
MWIAIYGLLGMALGAGYFGLLFLSVRLHASGTPAGRIIPLYVLRFAVAGVAFWFLAQQGAIPLLSALAGFLVARLLVQQRIRASQP